MNLLNRSLRARLALSLAALVLAALVALSALSAAMMWWVGVRSIDEALYEQHANIARALAQPELTPRGGALDTQGALTGITDTRVQQGGAVVWQSAAHTMPNAPGPGLSTTGGWRLLSGPAGPYDVTVGRPTALLTRTVVRHAQITLPLTVVLCALVGLAAWLIVGRSLQPLKMLARRVEHLDTHGPIPGAGRADEIGALARALEGSLNALRERRRAETQFVARASHELRTPVAALQAELEFALSRDRLASEYRAALHGARRAASHLERLSVNLLTLTRLDGVPPKLRPLDLWEAAADATDRFVPLALTKDLTLDVEGAPHTIQADAVLIARLLDNLLQNAIRHTDRGGVTVRVHGPTLSVTDTGPGIPQHLLDGPAELFGEHAGREGFGVGLNVVQSIARAHGARVNFERLTPHGTRVSVHFPETPPPT